MFDFLALCLSCQLTRIVTFQFGHGGEKWYFRWLGINQNSHDEIAHKDDGSDPLVSDKFFRISRWYAEQVAMLARALDRFPEGEGSVLDNTLVVWTRDFGEANAHGSYNMKFVLAQGQGGYLKTNPNGRYIKGVSGNKRQERILLNMAEAMGVTDYSTFGDIGADFKPNKIPLGELKA